MDLKKIRFLKNLATGLVVAAMVFAFLIAGIRIFGIQVYGVLTGSMEPAYPVGSLIYVNDVDAKDLRVNDVITFSLSPNVIATHRIVEIVPDESNPSVVRYRTKGDANKDVDASLVGANNIIGKVMFSIPKLGYIANYIQHPPGIYVAIFVCGMAIAFVFYTDSLENRNKASSKRSTRQGNAPKQRAHAPQPARQNPYYRQSPLSRQGDPSRRKAYPRQSEYLRQDGYSGENGCYQSEYLIQSGYYRQYEQPRQDDYYRRSEYPRQNSRPRQSEYYSQRAYPQQGNKVQKKEYTRPRDRRSGRM